VTKAMVEVPGDGLAHLPQFKGVFVWRETADRLVVYSRNCTDLSCPVTWDEGSGWFYCPCHGGIFNQQGEPVAGPPNRPLYRYATRVREGVVEIDLKSLPPMT
jgi:menaquinol-cytochrome c reductase iron-sulfur subunit